MTISVSAGHTLAVLSFLDNTLTEDIDCFIEREIITELMTSLENYLS